MTSSVGKCRNQFEIARGVFQHWVGPESELQGPRGETVAGAEV